VPGASSRRTMLSVNLTTSIKLMMVVLAVAGAALIGACGSAGPPSGSASSHATAKPSTPALVGPERFLTKVRAAGFGSKDFANATDAQLLKIGQVACNGLGTGLGYQDAILAFVQNDAKPTTHQATVLVDEAVRGLCPQYASLIPAGAP
jgi:hypothetical protein